MRAPRAFYDCAFLTVLIVIFAQCACNLRTAVFVTCVMFLVCDFWTVKNVTGRYESIKGSSIEFRWFQQLVGFARLLVGLRWWNEVMPDGSNRWVFESKPENRKVHPFDSLVFWTSLYVTPLVGYCMSLRAMCPYRYAWLYYISYCLKQTAPR